MNTDGHGEKEKNQQEQNYDSIEVLMFYSVVKKMEAAIGFEPMNEGFADLCLSHLATPP